MGTADRLDDVPAMAVEPSGWGIVVHYHEIGLKGRNRGAFERQLVRNIDRAVSAVDERPFVESLSGRLIVHTADRPAPEVVEAVASTFGVAFCAPSRLVGADLDEMGRVALELLAGRDFATFAIAAKRSTKDFAHTSREINVALGDVVREATGSKVQLSSPDVTVHVEVLGRRAFLFVDRIQGAGGLPVGTAGKVVVLLSGGIDSPVAAFRALRRGARAILVHFHSAPFTDTSSVRKAGELAAAIAARQGRTTLYSIPIGTAQQQIVVHAPPDLRVVLYRRLMMRIAERVAAGEGAKALVTGDSLGQVASQTLENLACADDVATMPVLRPLIGWDKQEIVAEAQAFGTYETSILPYEDCCSLFVPRSPATRATVDECRRAEAELDIDAMVSACLGEAEVTRL